MSDFSTIEGLTTLTAATKFLATDDEYGKRGYACLCGQIRDFIRDELSINGLSVVREIVNQAIPDSGSHVYVIECAEIVTPLWWQVVIMRVDNQPYTTHRIVPIDTSTRLWTASISATMTVTIIDSGNGGVYETVGQNGRFAVQVSLQSSTAYKIVLYAVGRIAT